MTDISIQSLRKAAEAVRANAHAPYSGFRVGVALEDESGRVWVGCNVENAAYPEGTCAETGAIAQMVAGGGARIARLLVVGGGDSLVPCTPCGGCRQRISEFATHETEIWLQAEDGGMVARSINDLLPNGFTLAQPPHSKTD